ncbi:MAG: substrate-binding domain-containing protein [Fibrobacteria bacterium]|nr:substrate-binding domain-containing protein [Fibrobacteria bacterium]
MARPPNRRRQVLDRIREALRTGRLRPGDLLRTGPDDASRWGTSHPTLRAAMRELESLGELISAPRGFRVPTPTVRGTSARVLWLAACADDGTIAGESEREMRLRRHLDLACRRDGLHLRVAGVDRSGRIFLEGFAATDLADVLKDAFGSVLCPWRMSNEGPILADRLARSGKPAALWGEGGLQGSHPVPSMARIFDNGHRGKAGRGVGIHLRELGHRQIAYLSVFHGSDWSHRRLEGLRTVIEGSGRIRPFATDGILHPLVSPPQPPALLDPILERLGSDARFLSHRIADIGAAHALLLREELLLRTLEPLCREAIQDESITAWVCSNDAQALLAMRWLREHGVDVPGRISVVGFDDSNRGQDQGLTSWSFSETDLAEAMVRHLVHPEIGAAQVRIEGTLVVRGSTSRAALAP